MCKNTHTTKNEHKHTQLLTVFPYSHEVLSPSVSAPNVVFLKAMLLRQPESSTMIIREKSGRQFIIVFHYDIDKQDV